jgi:nitroreductase
MTQLDLLDERRHVKVYDGESIPDKELIEKILWRAWKVTPSKNNFMPYHVNVLGPERASEKESIWMKSVKNKKSINETNIPKYHADYSEKHKVWKEDGYNAYFYHLKSAPYLLVFTQRVCTPNDYYRKSIEGGDFYEQMHEDHMESMLRTTAVEVGMFCANLAVFALEEGLHTSTIACFPHGDPDKWKDLPWVEHPVVLLASIGKSAQLRREHMNTAERKDDIKPSAETVIKWI